MRRLVDKLYQHRRRGRGGAEFYVPYANHRLTLDDATDTTIGTVLGGGRGVPVIVADNVAEHLFCDTEKEMWDWTEDFPSLAPPFARFWIDWRKPTRPLRTDGTVKVTPEQWAREYPRAVAVYCDATRLDDGGWGLGVVQFSEVGSIPWPVFDGVAWVFRLDDAGRFIEMVPKVMPGVPEWVEQASGVDMNIDEYIHSSASGLYPWGLTLSFLNCKNVERERVSPPEKAQRAHRRKHNATLVDYDVLKITPFGGGGSSSGGGGSEKRLHIVRGHFATYTEEAPLFGHFTGTVWRESHTRGHGPGHHEKRYDVQAPTGGTT